MYEMTQILAARGHQVTVISGETGYMHPERSGLPWYKRLFRREREGLVNIIRVYTPVNLHRSYFLRLLSFIAFSAQLPFALLFNRKPDVLLASSPPIFPMLPVVLASRLWRIPFVFEVRDLWPESAVQLGILRNRRLIGLMSWLEKLACDRASRIVTLTQGIKDNIQRRGWAEEKLHVITCGVDTTLLFPDPEAGMYIRARHGWEDRKVVLYLGAMGESNNLEVILEAARHLQGTQVMFVLIGDGMMRPHLQQRVKDISLDNVQILPPIPKMMAKDYLCAADICLATLRDIELFKGAIPTKLVEYMACGRPVLCGIAGEAANIVEQSGAGWVFPANDASRLAQMIVQLLADPRARIRMGEFGVAHVRSHFEINANCMQIEQLLKDAMADFERKKQ